MKARSLPPFHAVLAFEAVSRNGSFSKAADELCITHSAVSHRIKLLEDYYRVKLLERSNQRVVLTRKGSDLLAIVLESVETLERASQRLHQPERAVVRIGIGHAFARSWFMGKLASFYREHPEIELEVSAVPNTECLNMLRSGAIDVAVTYGADHGMQSFESIDILRTRCFPVCSPAYLERVGEPRHPEDLLQGALLRNSIQPWSPWFREAGIEVADIVIHGPFFNNMDLMLNAAVGGYGIGLAREALAYEDLAADRLVRLFDISIEANWRYRVFFAPNARTESHVKMFVHWISQFK